jgi:hypothetical protein
MYRQLFWTQTRSHVQHSYWVEVISSQGLHNQGDLVSCAIMNRVADNIGKESLSG